MKTKKITVEGEEKGEINLPRVFKEEYRPDLVQRAHLAEKSSNYQPKGTDTKAGLKNTAEYIGRRNSYLTTINTGNARLPRLKQSIRGKGREVRKVPQARGGRKAHPPKADKKIKEKINKKEKEKALKSAVAATANEERIKERGHKTGNQKNPIIVENELEKLKKTKEVSSFLEKIGLKEEVERSRKKRKIKQGRGKSRGRKYRKRRSVLIVAGEDKGIKRAGRNLPGVDITLAKNLSVSQLAPGGEPGRVTVYTENAIEQLKNT